MKGFPRIPPDALFRPSHCSAAVAGAGSAGTAGAAQALIRKLLSTGPS